MDVPSPVPKQRFETASGEEVLKEYQLDEVEIVPAKVIGRGAYGSVIEVNFRGLRCAGKKLHDIFFEETSTVERGSILQRFREECRILSQLRHPCIVQYLGVHYATGTTVPILVMEYLHMTLAECIDRYRNLSDKIAYPILHDVALGLRYLHGQKPPIVHRDLSANNVLVTTDMRAKISDLGVAKILNLTPSQITQMKLTTTPGTPAYMPPEAMKKNPKYGIKIDIYSYGVLILHVFCGRWPFPAEQVAQDPTHPERLIARSEIERREEYILEVGLDHPLMELTKQCLEFNQDNRPEASEIISKLEHQLCLVPPTFKNKAESVEWITQLKKDNDRLKLRVATLETENRRLQRVEPNSEAAVGTRNRDSQLLYPRAESFSSTSSAGSLDQATDWTETPHPCQPGAKLSWDAKCADLPVAMYQACAVAMTTAVYVGGGCTKGFDDIVFKYNLQLDCWNWLTSCPVTSFGLAQLDGKVLAIGGIKSSSEISNAVYNFDEDTQKWKRTLPALPTARHSLTTVSFQSNLIACGGKDASGVSDKVELFQLQSSQWTESCRLPFPCYRMSATIIRGSCCLLGGFDRYAFTDKVLYIPLASLLENSRPSSDTDARRKSAWFNLHSIRYCCAAAANMGGCLLAVGGVGAVGSPKVCVFSQLQKNWKKLTDLYDRNAYVSPAVAELPNGELLIIGGAKSNYEPQTSVYRGMIHY